MPKRSLTRRQNPGYVPSHSVPRPLTGQTRFPRERRTANGERRTPRRSDGGTADLSLLSALRQVSHSLRSLSLLLTGTGGRRHSGGGDDAPPRISLPPPAGRIGVRRYGGGDAPPRISLPLRQVSSFLRSLSPLSPLSPPRIRIPPSAAALLSPLPRSTAPSPLLSVFWQNNQVCFVLWRLCPCKHYTRRGKMVEASF